MQIFRFRIFDASKLGPSRPIGTGSDQFLAAIAGREITEELERLGYTDADVIGTNIMPIPGSFSWYIFVTVHSRKSLDGPEITKLHDDTEPVLAALAQLSEDKHATDRQRAVARAAYAEITKLKEKP